MTIREAFTEVMQEAGHTPEDIAAFCKRADEDSADMGLPSYEVVPPHLVDRFKAKLRQELPRILALDKLVTELNNIGNI